MRPLLAKPDQQENPGPSKRKLKEEHEPNGTKKKPRTRVSYSCSECHRRKQKCDRQIPCGHCIARKVPELCKGYTPGKSEADLHLRLTRIEQIIDMALPQYSQAVNSPGGEPSGMPDNRSFSNSPEPDAKDEQEPGGGSLNGTAWFGNSALPSVNSAPLLEQLQSGQLPSVVEESASAAEKLKSLVQECGVPPHKISELLQERPPQQLSDRLVDYYFTSINYTRYPIYEPHFRASYNAICANDVRLHPNDVRFLPLFFIVLAIAARLAPERIGGDERTRRLTSLRYYWSSRRSLLIAAAIQTDSVELVLARLLSARFLTFDRRITECWAHLGAAVRTAQALGLHRDGARMGLDPFQVEYRRRIWSYLYHADRTHALLLGRPQAIQDDYTSTLPPMNIEDSALTATPPSTVANPLSQPTPMTFCILRHQLAGIVGRIVHHFQQVRSHSHYSEVLALDNELTNFVSQLPPHFSMDPDTSLDAVHEYIPVHRFLIISEVFFVRISLHRPYILRKLESERFMPSRRACFESAKRDFEARQAFKKAVSADVINAVGWAYRQFQSAMVAGISLVLYPKNKDAPQMHRILDAFLRDHERLREYDETTRRELRIIEFLKSKAGPTTKSEPDEQMNGIGMEVDSMGRKMTGDSTAMDHAQATATASLLLGLGQAASNFSSPVSHHRTPILDHSVPPQTAAGPRQPFLSLALAPSHLSPNAGTPTHPSTPISPYAPPNPHSPSLVRAHHQRTNSADGGYGGSVAGSSPSGEDDAQRLLDNWVNNFNAPSGEMPFDGTSSLRYPGNDFLGSGIGSSAGVAGMDANGGDSSYQSAEGDWTYWEQLVNQLRHG